jgi:hypothetical protein
MGNAYCMGCSPQKNCLYRFSSQRATTDSSVFTMRLNEVEDFSWSEKNTICRYL